MSKIKETVVPVKGMKKWQRDEKKGAKFERLESWSQHEFPSGSMWPKEREPQRSADVSPILFLEEPHGCPPPEHSSTGALVYYSPLQPPIW